MEEIRKKIKKRGRINWKISSGRRELEEGKRKNGSKRRQTKEDKQKKRNSRREVGEEKRNQIS